jgi:hexosaminidase
MSGEASVFNDAGPVFYRTDYSGIKSVNYNPSKVRQAKISSSLPPSSSYPGRQGIATVGDGLKGKADFNGEDWCAWNGAPFTIEINFEHETSLDSLTIGILSSYSSWIYSPQSIEIQGSNDLVSYRKITAWTPEDLPSGRNEISLKAPNTRVKSLRIIVSPLKSIPEGKPGAGHIAWTFIDEIGVY